MVIDREVPTDKMLIIIATFDQSNQYRMRRNSQRLFDHIQSLGPVMALQIQITETVIVKGNSRTAGGLLARWVYMVDLECCYLNSNIYNLKEKRIIKRRRNQRGRQQ